MKNDLTERAISALREFRKALAELTPPRQLTNGDLFITTPAEKILREFCAAANDVREYIRKKDTERPN